MDTNVRKKTQKVGFEESKKRFEGRPDILLCEDGFNGWKKKSKFLDLVINEYFYSVPSDVLRLNTVHPKRRMTKKKTSSLTKFGTEHPTQSKTVKEKTKKTNLEKYGCEHYLQTEEKKQKTIQTNIEKYGHENHMHSSVVMEKQKKSFVEKYGCENPLQNEEIKKRQQQTLLQRYGAENPSQIEEFQKKKKETSLNNWGVEQPLSSGEVRSKIEHTNIERYGGKSPASSEVVVTKAKNTCMKKYGVTHYSKTTQHKHSTNMRRVKETGQWLDEWLDEQKEPKPAKVSILQNHPGQVEISLNDLSDYIDRYRSAKTNLERFTEQLFETVHYNKKVENVDFLNRPDFKISDKIYLNVDGLYWHSEHNHSSKHHFLLRKSFEQYDLRLFQFREDEIYHKTDIVKSIVSNSLGKTSTKIFARKCSVGIVSQKEANKFLNQNHLMGTTKAKHIGLFEADNQELVSVLSYKVTKNKIVKIERFCSQINSNVVGGFSKLLKHLEKSVVKQGILAIHNWVDLRYGTGAHLSQKGFQLQKETLGWKWTDGKMTYNRLHCKADKSKNLSEKENASMMKLYKIYDAGQRLWVKTYEI